MIRFPRAALAPVAIPGDAKAFLEDTGLPEAAPPYLSFHFRGSVPSLAEKFGLDADLDDDAAGLANLPVIGSSGSGDPICLDHDGRILVVNRDSDFSEAQVVNSSLPRLMACLASFEAYVRSTRDLAPLPGDAAAWRAELGRAATSLRRADPDIYGGFWHAALAAALTPLGFDRKHAQLGIDLAAVIAP
jgi:SUKH-4 immunity protein